MQIREGNTPVVEHGGGTPRRVAVFIDYWWVYTSARQVFGGAGAPPPPWFGNVTPAALANTLVKRPPASVRRSERVPAGVHVFVRSYDPEVHHGQHERVQRWLAGGATVNVGPKRDEGGGFWQSSVSVALAGAVVEALTAGQCDTAVVFAGDVALLPLVAQVAGTQEPSARIELATWVAPDGAVPSALAQAPGVWCHRLGETTFKAVSDDRRNARPGAGRAGSRPGPGAPRRPSGPPTAMAAALRAAGVVGGNGLKQQPLPPTPSEPAGRLHRLSQRLFGRAPDGTV